MSTSSVNAIYAQFKANLISREKAISLLVGEVFRTPQHYGLAYFSEDTKSEFLIWIHKYLPHMMERYDPDKSSFYTYLTNVVRMYTKSWKRSCAKTAAKTAVLDTYCVEMDETRQDDIADNLPAYNIPEQPVCGICSQLLTERQKLTFLILFLKSVQDITDVHIQKTAAVTGIPAETIETYAKKLEETLHFKRARLARIIEKKNTAYIRSKQYRLELENMNNTADTQYLIVSKKLETQKLLFKKALVQLETYGSITPSNSAIERLLGLTTGTVRRVLKQSHSVLGSVKDLLDRTDTGW